MSAERGQAQIEAVVLILLTLAGAALIGLAGASVRQVLVADAVGHAGAVAAHSGEDPLEVARSALPVARRADARVRLRDGWLEVRLPLPFGSQRGVSSRTWTGP